MHHDASLLAAIVEFGLVLVGLVTGLLAVNMHVWERKTRRFPSLPLGGPAQTFEESEAAWARLRIHKRRMLIGVLMIGPMWLGGGAARVNPILLLLVVLAYFAWLYATGRRVRRTCTCPACGGSYFALPGGQRVPSGAYCAACGIAFGKVPKTVRSPLAEFASERGMRVLHPRAVEAEVRGVRVAIERPAKRSGMTVVDVDALHVSEGNMKSLRTRVATNLPGARVVTRGTVTRLELPGESVDANALDEALDALGEACAPPERGPFR